MFFKPKQESNVSNIACAELSSTETCKPFARNYYCRRIIRSRNREAALADQCLNFCSEILYRHCGSSSSQKPGFSLRLYIKCCFLPLSTFLRKVKLSMCCPRMSFSLSAIILFTRCLVLIKIERWGETSKIYGFQVHLMTPPHVALRLLASGSPPMPAAASWLIRTPLAPAASAFSFLAESAEDMEGS